VIRILWNSDRIVGGTSAYSRVTREILFRLAERGWPVAHVPMGHANRMGKWVWKGVMIYPSGDDPWNEDVIVDHYVDWKADILVVLKDIWVLRSTYKWTLNFVPYVPIDHEPVSPSITSRLHTAFRIMVPSRFAQRELRRAGVDIPVSYVPHGVDCKVFRPLEDRERCKRAWFLEPDDFTVLVIARNQSRKMIPRMLRVYKRFLENNPDVESHMLLWTDVRPKGVRKRYEGALAMGVADVSVHLLPEIMELGLGEKVMWPDEKLIMEGLPDWSGGGQDMVGLYNAADVVLLTTGGEGAGLPLLEGAACGTIGVTTDYAAGPEYVGPGLAVPASDYVVLNTPGTRYALVDIDRAAEALEKIMNGDRGRMARKCRRWAERFDWGRVMEKYVIPFFEECESELYPKVSSKGVESWAR